MAHKQEATFNVGADKLQDANAIVAKHGGFVRKDSDNAITVSASTDSMPKIRRELDALTTGASVGNVPADPLTASQLGAVPSTLEDAQNQSDDLPPAPPLT